MARFGYDICSEPRLRVPSTAQIVRFVNSRARRVPVAGLDGDI
jgi:hypothetical protein